MKVMKNLIAPKRSDGNLVRNQKLVQGMQLAEKQVLDTNQIQLGDMLGQGGFAKVHHCTLDGQGAVAKLIKSEQLNEEMTYLLTNEVGVWRNLAHRNIIKFFGMASTGTHIWLVCEYMADGSLLEQHEKLRKQKAPPSAYSHVLDQLYQVASGMAYLHALNPIVLHRDLKSANILRSEGGKRLAIADFGLARYQANCGVKMTAETGSYRWMAPEVIRHEEYDWRCDVYSYAILAWEMLTFRIPFDNMMPVEAAFAVAREETRPPLPDTCPAVLRDLILVCWSQRPNPRPGFDQICEVLAAEQAAHADATASGES